jgi:hypothetical protein
MLYRTFVGAFLTINKYDYKIDKLYYKKIMEIKEPFSKLEEKTFDNKNDKQSQK